MILAAEKHRGLTVVHCPAFDGRRTSVGVCQRCAQFRGAYYHQGTYYQGNVTAIDCAKSEGVSV